MASIPFERLRLQFGILSLVLCLLGASMAECSEKGQVTNLPIPRFVSLKTSEGNVRRGPSLSHRIDWIYKRKNMPLEVTAEFGHWRRVRDREGAGGWVHYSLLSGTRHVIVEGEVVDMLSRPEANAQIRARAEGGVIAKLGDCGPEWCQITADRNRGWVRKADIWGVAADEVRD